MSKEKISELQDKLFSLERRIKPLEWDASRNQINEFKKQELSKLKEQHQQVISELNELQQS